jgi:hypothetical protein
MLLMEMMDIREAIRWFNESSDLMVGLGKTLELQPKGETDFLRRESIAAQRVFIENALNTSIVTAILISDQMILELPLLMGHAEEYGALVKAQARYREESSKACSVLKKTGPVSEIVPAGPEAPEPETLVNRQKRIDKRLEELRAKSSPPAASTAVPVSEADNNVSSTPSETLVDAAPIIVRGNVDQSTEGSD